MEQIYLSGTIRERIKEQLALKKMKQAQLAKIIGLSEAAFSRFMSGETTKLDHQYVIRIAREFKVSTDFLLGGTNVPDRKNYDIEELGLSPHGGSESVYSLCRSQSGFLSAEKSEVCYDSYIDCRVSGRNACRRDRHAK